MSGRGDEFVTMGEAAAILGVSRMKLYMLVREGTLPTYLVPLDYKRRYVKRADLARAAVAVPAQPGRKKRGATKP